MDLETLDGLVSSVTVVAAQQARAVDLDASFPAEAVEALRKKGLMALIVPEREGGLGGDLSDYARTAEALGGTCMATALIWTMHCQQVDAISRHAVGDLRNEAIESIVKGFYVGSVTTDESTGGSLYSASSAIAPDPTSGQILLDRRAPIVTGGRHADAFLIKVRDSEEATSRETSLVFAPRADLQITVERDWNMLGMRGVENVSMRLSGELKGTYVVGRRGGFADIATDSFGPLAHIGWSASWLGCARSAAQRTTRFLRVRKSSKLKDSSVRESLAQVRMRLEVVSSLLWSCIQEVQRLRQEGRHLGEPSTQFRLNTLKLVASRECQRAVEELVNIVGLEHGYSQDSPLALERALRDMHAASLLYSNQRLRHSNGALAVLDPDVSVYGFAAANPYGRDKAGEVPR